jgi:hypothetical protein
MPETPGPEPAASHGEAGKAGEAIQVIRRTAADHETSNDEETGE